MLEINQITKSFNHSTVLDGVSLTVRSGQLVHIAGANGSGKSTLFKIITGLLDPDAGTVSIDDDDYIGALIENPGFLEFETGMNNLKFLADLNHNFDKKSVIELMHQFQLDPDNHQAVSKYSVGMRQKLGIIQAVMENQNIILLDEPTRGLDQNSINQFIKLVNNLVRQQSSVIVASHDNVDGIQYNRRLSLLDGRLVDE
ncbi:ATP-binding cassette domain-containing protein [Schleiferilactobacillus perolens]|jgi:ABC-2 type transport system ATP-binding protein|uniref:ATP-binding cassette domain-containing protein n=1 Tax=Schleiferilactobacillus perolens TaxID=100468 RepID=UPI0023524062|nr:ABC transporter ATP-binding protein [Schleiferilactobacillus perolens]MCI2172053.1 ABC transporter ATP-binding protein [Schleiferilactobacillus perolens]